MTCVNSEFRGLISKDELIGNECQHIQNVVLIERSTEFLK